MRISCPKDDLLKHLQVVARGVSQRSSVQILSGVLIDAHSAELPVELAATDMELSVRGKLPAAADVLEPGRAEQGVGERVSEDVAVRVARQAARMLEPNAAEHERDVLLEGVRIEAGADAVLRHGRAPPAAR